MSDSDFQDDDVKVILLGETKVGKTNLINTLIGNTFNENEESTIASTFSVKKISVMGKVYSIQIWDTIGQEKLRNLTQLFYNNSKIVIFVYDITRKKSFNEIRDYWVNNVEEKLGQEIVKGIVANKLDLFLNEEVSQNEGEEYAGSIDALFLATSAKTDSPKKFENFIADLFQLYLKKFVYKSSEGQNIQKIKSVHLDKNTNVINNPGKKCC